MKNSILKKITITMLTILGFSALLFAISIKAQSIKPYNDFLKFKFAFISDTNLSYGRENKQILYSLSQVLFQDAVKTVNNTKNLNFVIFGGDILHNADGKYYELPSFLDLTESVKVPYYFIFGDNESNNEEGFSKNDITSEFKRNIFTEDNKTYWKSVSIENVLIIGLDSSQTNKNIGAIDKEQMCWLQNVLNANPNKFTVILMHHLAKPLEQDLNKPFSRNYSIENSEEFTDVISKCPQVKLVVSGSRYVNSVRKINNALYISVPSIAVYPNYFDEIEVSPDKVIINHKITTYKQIIKLAKNNLIKSEFAKSYNFKNSKEIIKFHEGDEFSNLKEYPF